MIIFWDKRLPKAIIILFILALTLLIPFCPEIVVATDKAIQFDLPSEDEVEILILLEDQVDTKRIAAWTRRSQPFFIDPAVREKRIRSEVFKALEHKAEVGQDSLLKFLKDRENADSVFELESYYIVNMVYARVSKEFVETIARRSEVNSIWLNQEIEIAETKLKPASSQFGSVEWNIDHIRASEVWSDFNIDGTGIVVGIIDTGVDWQHETLKMNYRGYNPLNPESPDHNYNWYDPHYGSSSPDDNIGHGTFIAGIAVGSDLLGENQIGVAPGAQWIAARGLDDNGQGTYADLLKAMEFMLAPTPNADGSGVPRPDMAPDIVNNSWGGSTVCNPFFKEAINNWRNAGILPVFSGGNFGPDEGSIRLPANYYDSFTVGAVNSDNKLAYFSSRGPGACGDFIKPNISAPGKNIRSALSSQLGYEKSYAVGSGSSMAAPHVAGVAALLGQADPHLSINKLEQILQETAFALTSASYPDSPNYGFGHGLVDAYAAVSSIMNLTVNIDLFSSPKHGGTVTGVGFYEPGQEITVSAEAYPGFSFKNWTNNQTIISNDSIYTFIAENGLLLTANFEVVEIEPTDPKYIYYVNNNGSLVKADYELAVDKLFEGEPKHRDIISEAVAKAIEEFRSVFVEDEIGRTIDYSKAVNEKITYFDATMDLLTFGAPMQEPDKILVVDPETGEAAEKVISVIY